VLAPANIVREKVPSSRWWFGGQLIFVLGPAGPQAPV
jgi:hypothetical protein